MSFTAFVVNGYARGRIVQSVLCARIFPEWLWVALKRLTGIGYAFCGDKAARTLS
jgi:hypothetical protein